MKVKQLVVMISLLALWGSVRAQQVTAAQLERDLNSAVLLQQARVQLTLDLEKEVRMRDLMTRPPRMGAGNPVIEVKKTKQSCQGVLLEGSKQVAAPAVCFKKDDYTLQAVHLLFANGQKATGSSKSVSIKNDMGYIQLGPKTAQGLRGLPVGIVKKDSSLQETFGSNMTLALHRFFSSFGVAFKKRVCRIGSYPSYNRLEVGEPVIFEGKLVALVKQIPHRYSTPFGSVSESSLALFRS